MDNNEKTAKYIVAKIEWDINDRRGLHMSGFDEDIQEEIRETWKKLILKVLNSKESK